MVWYEVGIAGYTLWTVYDAGMSAYEVRGASIKDGSAEILSAFHSVCCLG